MKRNLVKIASYSAFGITAAVLGVVVTGLVSAQVAPLNCDANSTGFSGWIACYIGSPAAGIPGAGTLFAGQKVLSDKIAAGGGGGSGSNPKVYMERKDENGNLVSVFLGQIIQDEITGSLWGFDNCYVGGTNVSGSASCPTLPMTFKGGLSVIFHPDLAWVSATNAFRTLQGQRVDPSLCFVRQNPGGNQIGIDNSLALQHVQFFTVTCSYIPNTEAGDASVISKYDYGFRPTNVPVTQEFRIRTK